MHYVYKYVLLGFLSCTSYAAEIKSLPPSLGDRIYSFVVDFFNSVANNPKLANVKSKEDRSTADLKPIVEEQASKTSQQVLANQRYTRFVQGANFNFDLNITKTEHRSVSRSVKYGLIVKEIIPNQNPSNFASMDADWTYANKAKVVYDIGPLDEAEHRPIYIPEEHVQTPSFGLSTKFNGRVTPLFKSGIVDPPDFRFNLVQEQGYYELIYTAPAKFDTHVTEHQFNVPIANGLQYGRRYNEEWEVVRTSANNVWMSTKVIMNVYYLNKEDRYGSDLRCIQNRYEITNEVQLDKQEFDKDKLPTGKYLAGYRYTF